MKRNGSLMHLFMIGLLLSLSLVIEIYAEDVIVADVVSDIVETIEVDNELLPASANTCTLSARNKDHLNKHIYESFYEQAQHMSNDVLSRTLSSRTFFNKSWSTSTVYSKVEAAWTARWGQTGTFECGSGNDKFLLILKNGNFETAYGLYSFTVDDFWR